MQVTMDVDSESRRSSMLMLQPPTEHTDLTYEREQQAHAQPMKTSLQPAPMAKKSKVLHLKLKKSDRKLPVSDQLAKLLRFAHTNGMKQVGVAKLSSGAKRQQLPLPTTKIATNCTRETFGSSLLPANSDNQQVSSETRIISVKAFDKTNMKQKSTCKNSKQKTYLTYSHCKFEDWFSRIITCFKCREIVVGPLSFLKHLREFHYLVYTACKPCQIFHNNPNDVKKHQLKYHKNNIIHPAVTVNEKYFAKVVPAVFKSLQNQMKEDNSPQVICFACDCKFQSKSELFAHQHKECHQPVHCKHCDIDFATKEEHKIHLQNHDKFNCLSCELTFLSSVARHRHVLREHPESKVMKCEKCNKRFKTFAELQAHSHKTELLCEICGEQSFNAFSYLLHMNKHKTKENHFSCPDCQRRFVRKSALVSHNRRIHLADVKYQCNECSKKFFHKRRLEMHMSLHTQHFKYKCKICGACFTRPCNMNIHAKNNHRYSCPICRDIFTSAKAVIDHRSTHSADEIKDSESQGNQLFDKFTDFQCDICSKFLASKQSLDFHLQTHQGKSFDSKLKSRCQKKKKC